MSRLSRRQFMVGAGGLGCTLLAGCAASTSESRLPERVYRVGYLGFGPREWTTTPDPDTTPIVNAHRDNLREYGYIEGHNLRLEWRITDGGVERARVLADELVRLPVDLIIASGVLAALAAKQATTTIPIAFTNVADPVGSGLVASLARPGGNATGVALQPQGALREKHLELLKETVPDMQRVAVLADADIAARPGPDLGSAAHALGLQLLPFEIRNAEDISTAVSAVVGVRAQGLLLSLSARLSSGPIMAQVAALALQHGLPGISALRHFAEVGGLMAYGADPAVGSRRVAYYADRILRGTKPADLPVEQPMRFDFVVNMKTARELGITFPHEILLQITEVVE
jgi:putative ABC transport system substrate-binding protein